MAAITRRASVPVKIGNVWVGGNHPIVVQSMTNTDTADVAVHRQPGDGAGASRLGAGARHRQHRSRRPAVPKIVDTLDKFGVRVPIIGDFHYNGHILLKKYPDMRARAGQVPHQSRQRQHRQEARRQFPHHDRGRHRVRPPGAHRRQLGLARSRAAHAHDGRELARCRSRRTPAKSRCDAIVASAHRIRPRPPSATGSAATSIILSAKVSGVQDLIDVYRMLAARVRLRAAPGAHRSRPGIEGHRGHHRRARACCCRKASATPSAPRSRRCPMATAPKK